VQQNQEKSEDDIAYGVMHGLAAMFLLAVMQACGKMISDQGHSVVETAFYRSVFAIIPLTIFVFATKQTHLLRTNKPVALLFRVLIGFTGLIATFGAYAMLPMSNATVIIMTSVLMVPALSFFILKEYIGPHRWAAIIIGLLGVVVMVGPSGDFIVMGAVVAFVAAMLQAGIQIFLRHLKSENPFTVTYYFILGGAVIGGILMPFFATAPSFSGWLLFVAVGLTGGLAQFCLTSAFKYAPAAVISPLNYTGLLWASMLDMAIWHHAPGLPVFIGAGIIVLSQAYILHRERVARSRNRGN
jgi:drug/metabolite transporter (DMT)-like permease